jgi:hypothetical protein
MTFQTQTQTQAQPNHHLVIQGMTNRGQMFLPRNWADRLYSCVSDLGSDHRRHQYEPHVYVSFNSVPGIESLIVEDELKESNPQGYDYLMSFAHENNLRVSEESEQIH